MSRLDGTDKLRSLVRVWGLLADVGFCDLLLVEPERVNQSPDDVPRTWKVTAQIRPTTHQTLYTDDLIGTTVSITDRPALAEVWNKTTFVEGSVSAIGSESYAKSRAIPVTYTTVEGSRSIAVVLCEEALDAGRRRGLLERTYLEIFDQLSRLLTQGRFPFPEEFEPLENLRVGDGVIVFAADATVRFASPNATSALHRLGVLANPEGKELHQLGLNAPWLRQIRSATTPISGELIAVSKSDRAAGLVPAIEIRAVSTVSVDTPTIIGTYLLPLIDGSMLLLRDVTDARRKDRLILSKDATIREVHHRVKNNLQTISALLRLQGRRMASDDAKAAIEDSVRRIRSMALVHETLSHGVATDVPFNDIIRPLLRIVEEGIQGADRPIRFHVDGTAGELPAEIATPLSIVLVELLQNAVEHGYPRTHTDDRARHGVVSVRFDRSDDHQPEPQLRVVVHDDGVGFPAGFSLSTTRSLGLTIVRTLVTSELGGLISTTNHNGAVVDLRLPLRQTQPS